MTRRSKRELERSVAQLGEDGAPADGFMYVRIGGDPDADAGGYYRWSDERGVYVNDDGHELGPEWAPDGGVTFNIEGMDR